MRSDLKPRRVGEAADVTFDLAADLGSETIATQSVAAAVYSGADPAPAALIDGAASASGSVVTQALSPLVSGVLYLLTCTVTTSGGQTLKQQGYLSVT